MNTLMKHMRPVRGFTLVQISIILTVASLVMVAVLPAYHTQLDANKVTMDRMNAVMVALRQYEAANGALPCPADASLPIGDPSYGIAPQYSQGMWYWAKYPCSVPSASNFMDSVPSGGFHIGPPVLPTGPHMNVAIGMVPVRDLGLSNEYALDGYNRYITYAMDTDLEWIQSSSPSWPYRGNIAIDDNGVINYSIVALVSHGSNGHGAWLPLNAATGTSARLSTGSTDNDEHVVNAHGNADGSFPANHTPITAWVPDSAGNTVMFVKKPPTSTFDDLVVYQSPSWNINAMPESNYVAVFSPPPNGVYVMGQDIPFKLTYPLPLLANSAPIAPTVISTINAISDDSYSDTYNSYGLIVPSMDMNMIVPYYYAPETGTYGVQVTSPSSGAYMSNTNLGGAYFKLPNTSGILNGTAGNLTGPPGVRLSATPGIFVDNTADCAGDPCINLVDSLNNRASRWSARTYAVYAPGAFSGGATYPFLNPSGITGDSSNNLYVVDSGNSRIVKKTPGNVYSSWGSWGNTYAGNQYCYPSGIATDTSTSGSGCGTGPCLWIADTCSNFIKACSVAGPAAVCNMVGAGTYNPTGIAVDSGNNVYYTSGQNVILAITNTGTLKNFASGHNYIGNNTKVVSSHDNGYFNQPTGVAVYNTGTANLWVSDSLNHRIQVFSFDGTWQFTIGGGGICKNPSIYGGSCTLSANPAMPTVDNSISTTNYCYNNIGCVAGAGQLYFNNPSAITFSTASGTPYIYVVDTSNNRVIVLNMSGGYVTSFGSYGNGSNNFNF